MTGDQKALIADLRKSAAMLQQFHADSKNEIKRLEEWCLLTQNFMGLDVASDLWSSRYTLIKSEWELENGTIGL